MFDEVLEVGALGFDGGHCCGGAVAGDDFGVGVAEFEKFGERVDPAFGGRTS